MATSDPPPIEVPQWLKALPLAPEYHPTLAEFQDPISYILKIEPEASSFGICKIVPPLPVAPKKTAIANLNRSFAARDPNPKKPPTFSTRQQQIGFCPRRPRPVQKPVWQSGDSYTLQQFEAKARQFEKAQTKRFLSKKNALSAMEIETLFWKACADKPLTVEYANDMPGSGFAPFGGPGRRWWREEEAGNVGETAWNMRGVSRAKGSLLRFMKEEIPGVTSPMVYVAMLFSWFAWHVEDHELHSLNYLHMGSGKTWYGVPRDAGLAFEEVIRVQGYGGEVNPLVTFTILGEKTTVMSPEVLIGAGIPCCRLVQNAGEFVVTFPGSYHSGFSHGFNCGEAANIATPGWLRYAKEAAIRRASINYPPMVSHFQLLYSLALSLCSRMPSGSGTEPRSSRLKDKKRGGGEMMIKDIFVQSVIENNDLLSILRDKGSSCVVLPRNTSDSPLYSNSFIKSQIKIKPRLSLGLCSREEALEASRNLPSDDVTLARNVGIGHLNAFCSVKGVSVGQDNKVILATCSKSGTVDINSSDSQNLEREKESTLHGDGLLDQGLLSCVTCGILSFACVAVVHPREAAARYLMSADCGFLNDQNIGVGEISAINHGTNWNGTTCGPVSGSGKIESDFQDRMDDNLVNCSTYSVQVVDHSAEVGSTETTKKGISALDLLATAYGDSSESEEEGLADFSVCTDENDLNHESNFVSKTQNLCSNKVPFEDPELHMYGAGCQNVLSTETSHFTSGSEELNYLGSPMAEDQCHLNVEFSGWTQPENTKSSVLNNLEENKEMGTFSSSTKSMGEPMNGGSMELDSSCHTAGIAKISDGFFLQPNNYCSSPALNGNTAISTQSRNHENKINSSTISAMQTSDKDSSRMHVFCLEHALEVEKQLQPIGGVHIMLLCHSDYPKIEAQAKLLAEEMEFDHEWQDIDFREATQNDIERIRKALEDEEVIPTNRDWAVKLGINLYYSANLSKSPLYSKQMPYNAVIYKAFGCSSPNNSPVKSQAPGRRPGRQKKIVVAGRWCGKVWMSNQVHPYLAHWKDAQEEERAGQHARATAEKKYKEVEMETVEATSQATPRRRKSLDNSISASKSGKKRKKPLARTGTKKPRCTQSADNSSKAIEDATEISSVQSGRVLRSCRRLKMKDEAEGGRSCRRLKMKDEADGSRSCRRVKIKDEADGGRGCRRLKMKEEADGGQSCHRLKMKDEGDGGPSTRLRKRPSKAEESKRTKTTGKKQTTKKKAKKTQDSKNIVAKDEEDEGEYACNIEGCAMSFSTKHDLVLHKKDICPEKGCGKKFFSHKYLVQHRKVHIDDRPLECPWKGCKMRFKWSWARTEHIRVHTGDRPYVCRESGCGQTFRFVSDFSRHKRKTGHSMKKGRR